MMLANNNGKTMTYEVVVKYQDNNKSMDVILCHSLGEAKELGLSLAGTFDKIEIYIDQAICYVADRFTNFEFITI